MKKMHPIVWTILCLPFVYFAMVTASVYIPGENIFALLERISTMVRRPDLLRWTAYTPRFLLVFLLLYGGGVLLYYADHENRRPGEEYGSAKWGNARELNKRYADQNGKNVILTKHVSIGLDGYKHQRNLNILVVGGSGSGKTRFFCKPGIMSVNCSYLIVDPKGEMLRSTGYLLKDEGYDIKVFDLIHPRQSDGYNPFTYIRDDPDVLKLMDNLVKNTTPPKGASNDPFWEKAEIALDSALMLYLLYEAPAEEQNFEMLMFMLECARVMEEDEQYQSPLDLLFQTLEERDPSHIAVREYKVYKQAAGKTAKSILVTASVRLAAFIFPQYAAMMQTDEMDFASMGERKRAIFCVIPVNDGSMNYLVSMLLTQCFQQLYLRADERYNGRLPVPVRVIQDEWANVAQPDSYPKVLATCRSYIDTRNRIICYDIQDLGENLKPIGLLVMLDSILNRVIRNRQQGRYTHVYIDEIYLFFASPGVGGKSAINNYSSEFLYKCWKRFRKYYATLTGITQNVEECLLSDTARLMFANSEFLVLLNQAPTDRAELAKLLDASDAQMDYVSDAPAGHGLIKVGSCLVPFINELPRDTELYRLMTTKPGEQNA